jgi:ferredoxin
MADKLAKNQDNKPGQYYVDDQCIACDACVVIAPAFFSMNDIEGRAFVCNQPVNATETLLCEEALKDCPVAAIGNDGK